MGGGESIARISDMRIKFDQNPGCIWSDAQKPGLMDRLNTSFTNNLANLKI